MKQLSLTLLAAAALLAGCRKESQSLELQSPSAYAMTTPGKYITYRLDSMLYVNFGATQVVRSYQEKHLVDQQITDLLGRPSYRVFRYLRDTLGTQAWKPAGSYYVTPTTTAVELIEDNLRFLKLTTPVKEGYSWRGNTYLPDDPYSNNFDFSNDNSMEDWDYTYTEVDGQARLGGKTYDSVLTVLQVDDASNAPVTDPMQFGSRDYWIERYAKGLGLIYRETVMWEYQAPSAPRPGYRGFGVKRSIIDHN